MADMCTLLLERYMQLLLLLLLLLCLFFWFLSQEYDAIMPTYGLVVDVAVTGIKKTVVIRSPIQVQE